MVVLPAASSPNIKIRCEAARAMANQHRRLGRNPDECGVATGWASGLTISRFPNSLPEPANASIRGAKQGI